MAKKAIKVFVLSICIGLAFGLYLYFIVDHRSSRIVNSVLSSCTIGSLMMLCIYLRKYLDYLTRVQYLKVILMLLLLMLAAVAGSELTLLIQSFIFDTPYIFFKGGNMYILNIIIVFVAGIPIYVNEEWKNAVTSQLVQQQYQVLKLEQQNTLFELELLRAKINPHFLYNVHNSIVGLISKDPAKAETMVLLLSKFFRFTLTKDSATFHSISEELEIVKTYLDLQRIRYEDRLQYEVTFDSVPSNLQIPSYILQPLVENSIKHGIEKISQPGLIQIDISMNKEHVVIRVFDNGPAFSNLAGSGVGLQIVNNKLQLLYKGKFEIEFINTWPH